MGVNVTVLLALVVADQGKLEITVNKVNMALLYLKIAWLPENKDQTITLFLRSTDCPDGTWGQNCGMACRCLNNGECDKKVGTCNCASGYDGPRCADSECMIFSILWVWIETFFSVSRDLPALNPIVNRILYQVIYLSKRCQHSIPFGVVQKL